MGLKLPVGYFYTSIFLIIIYNEFSILKFGTIDAWYLIRRIYEFKKNNANLKYKEHHHEKIYYIYNSFLFKLWDHLNSLGP
jgi:hypothetical protein